MVERSAVNREALIRYSDDRNVEGEPISNIRPCSKARRRGLQIHVGQFDSDAGCHFKCLISITDRTLGYGPREGLGSIPP